MMNVKELIEKLKEMPQDAVVLLYDGEPVDDIIPDNDVVRII